jgi:phosphoenolpyruvate synthase/pyruvate phosphate dikinase
VGAGAIIGWFEEIGLGDRPEVGGKGGSLGELTRAGIAVPPGFVVRTRAFEQFLANLEREDPVRSRVSALRPDDLDGIRACAESLGQRVGNASLPQALVDELTAAYDRLRARSGQPDVAVRSSATTEDASDASFAGLQDTFLWVRDGVQLLERVRGCWASLYSVESISYRRHRGIAERDVAMAVVVQSMVDSRSAGVMFTRSPLTGDRSVVTIEGAWGLGSAVVAGEVTPDRWVLGKITGEISVREISDKHIEHRSAAAGGVEASAVPDDRRRGACLSDAELEQLRQVARKVERHYGCAQDIEWAIDSRGDLLLLQSRPETVWSSKEIAPAARAADDPLSHVMSIFGGRR